MGRSRKAFYWKPANCRDDSEPLQRCHRRHFCKPVKHFAKDGVSAVSGFKKEPLHRWPSHRTADLHQRRNRRTALEQAHWENRERTRYSIWRKFHCHFNRLPDAYLRHEQGCIQQTVTVARQSLQLHPEWRQYLRIDLERFSTQNFTFKQQHHLVPQSLFHAVPRSEAEPQPAIVQPRRRTHAAQWRQRLRYRKFSK